MSTPRRRRQATRPQVSPEPLNIIQEQQPQPYEPDPPFDEDLAALALTDADMQLLNAWETDLLAQRMEYCTRCKREWFDLNLRYGVCRICHRRDQSRPEDSPFFFSRENALDFGAVPSHLPELSQVEEMLIARVHVHVQVFQYRGQQYKYSGHVINFLRDVGSVYSQLPLLPADLDVVILRPRNATDRPHFVRQFSRQFRVRQNHVRTWLRYLIEHHPGYRDVEVDEDRLDQLPEDADVSSSFINEAIEEVAAEDDPREEDMRGADDFDAGAVPNFIAAQADLEHLRAQVEGEFIPSGEQIPLREVRPYIELPHIRSTPLNELNRSQALLSLAFPERRGRLCCSQTTNYHLCRLHRARVEMARRPLCTPPTLSLCRL
jgi:hypothetical protein